MADALRITPRDALDLYQGSSLHELAARAAAATDRRHPGRVRTYVVERNINYTNVCCSRCSFCAFSVSPLSKQAFILSDEQIAGKIEELLALGGTQILLQGGLNPHLTWRWYERMLRGIKARFPRLHVHGFSPPEIVFMGRRFDLTVSEVLERLRAAGLDSLPGGAEILADRVRRLIAPAKCSADEWLEVMRQAHRLGIYTTATMMFGHVESLAERIEHLERLRQLQDESLAQRHKHAARGCFTAFTCWPFQAGRTRLGRRQKYNPQSGQQRRADQLLLAGAYEQLKMTALARLYLDNIPNIQASWVTQGPKIGQLSLLMGCNDMGSLMIEENVVAAAGTSFALKLQELRELIAGAGFVPVQRDFYYRPTRPDEQACPGAAGGGIQAEKNFKNLFDKRRGS